MRVDLLKPYPKMKNSGVKWLGEVPSHWDVRRLRAAVKLLVSNVDKHTKHGEMPVRLCNYTDIQREEFIHDGLDFMRATATPEEIENLRLLAGDVLITKDAQVGIPALVTEAADDVIPGYHTAILRPLDGLSGGYLFRAAQSRAVFSQFKVEAVGVTLHGISHTKIKSIQIPLPPPDEQAGIVRFLDSADARLERAIRAKRKVIALLNEQKQAVIHRAVTRGLDDSVTLKPSGIPWIGDIPNRWNVRRLRAIAQLRVSNVDKHSNEGELPVRLCNYVDVYKNEFIHNGLEFMRATATREEVEKFRLRTDDVLITKDSESWQDIGVPALVTGEAGDVVLGYHTAILRPFSLGLSGRYLFRALQSRMVACQFNIAAVGITRFGLSQNGIKSAQIPLPPLAEQITIADFLDGESERFSRVISRLEREIDLLREYRTRLVADVVTGKVDVRGVKVPEVDINGANGDTIGVDDGDN